MKTLFSPKKLAAFLAAACLGCGSLLQAQTADGALPADIAPGTPLADVVKLVQTGVDAGTVKNYIANAPGAFDLNAEQILSLTDLGVPSDVINAMLAHDKNLAAAAPAPVSAPPANPAETAPAAPPATDVTVDYFNSTLTPYGSWVEVDGYGRCWRPTTVIYDSTWQPYCDRGHWVYTDNGWYWDSDYAWGVTFHYGRWFRDARFGWCWWPDTVWGPSWVSWRSADDYCGWAPLPPFAVYRPGVGFFYRGAAVSVGFDFGLGYDRFIFVGADHFCDRHPRNFRVEAGRAPEIFRRTAVINNYSYGGDHRVIVNAGIPVDRIRTATHRDLRPVTVNALPNAVRQGWRGPGYETANQNRAPQRPVNAGGGELRHGPAVIDAPNNANANRSQSFGQPAHSANQIGNPVLTPRPQSSEQPGNHPAVAPVHTEQFRTANAPAPAQNNVPSIQRSNPQAESHSYVAPTVPERRQPQIVAPTAPAAPERRQQQIEAPSSPVFNTPRATATQPASPSNAGQFRNGTGGSNYKTDKDSQNH